MTESLHHYFSSCAECGAKIADGDRTCQQLFEEVIAREFSDYTYAKVHRLTVDVYALQHPDKYMKSAKSFAAHLTGIYAALDLDSKASTDQIIQQWLNKPVKFMRPEPPPPGRRGQLTISSIHEARNGEEHRDRVNEWAESTWSAWQNYEHLAKSWIDEAETEFAKLNKA